METGEKFHRVLPTGKPKKYVMYAQIRCDVLSTCASKIETIFKMAGVEFVRLLEPDPPETLASYSDRIYSGKAVEIIELTDGMSRMFYLAAPLAPVRLEEGSNPNLPSFLM